MAGTATGATMSAMMTAGQLAPSRRLHVTPTAHPAVDARPAATRRSRREGQGDRTLTLPSLTQPSRSLDPILTPNAAGTTGTGTTAIGETATTTIGTATVETATTTGAIATATAMTGVATVTTGATGTDVSSTAAVRAWAVPADEAPSEDALGSRTRKGPARTRCRPESAGLARRRSGRTVCVRCTTRCRFCVILFS